MMASLEESVQPWLKGSSALEKISLAFKSVDDAPRAFQPRSFGTSGRKIDLIVNYFEINIPHKIYHYELEVKKVCRWTNEKYVIVRRKIIRQVIETMLKQNSLFKKAHAAYDGVKNLYTCNPLSIFFVQVDDYNQYEVVIRPVNKEGYTLPTLSFEPLHRWFKEKCSGTSEEIHRCAVALETILRHGLELKSLPVGRSFYKKPDGGGLSLSGGQELWEGYHQSIKIVQWKPMINIDMSAATFYKHGPVIAYMMDRLYPGKSNKENRVEIGKIKLSNKKRCVLGNALKTLKIETTHLPRPTTYKVRGISKNGADSTYFLQNRKGSILDWFKLEYWMKGMAKQEKVSVSDYFKSEYRELKFPNLPCLDVGSPKKSIYLPLEVCNIVEGQHCKKKLTDTQIAEIIRYTAKPPEKRFRNIQRIIQDANEQFRPFAREIGIRINIEPIKLTGRVLAPPHIMYDEGKKIIPKNGAWNMKEKRFFSGKTIEKWVLISFSTARWCTDEILEKFAIMLCEGGEEVGITFAKPVLIQNYGIKRLPGEIIKNIVETNANLELAVVVLPSRGPQSIYSKIKTVAETEVGLMTQCIKDENITQKNCTPQLLCNLCQKINAKMGGINSLAVRDKQSILKRPVIIIGADCIHPSPGDKINVSVAAVVGSLDGYFSRYKASVRVQEPKMIEKYITARQEIIVDLKDMVKELLGEFYRNTTGKKPEKIIFYRNGVSEGEFSKVVREEVRQVRDACKEHSAPEEYKPPITFIVVRRRHHIRFAPQNRNDGVGSHFNVPPGTTVDTVVTHPIDSDFYMCSHTGIQGTSRPAHYTVLLDENDLDADELQSLTYFLCHTYVRCTQSISVPCPVRYAHLAATHGKHYLTCKSKQISRSCTDSTLPSQTEAVKNMEIAIKPVKRMENTMYFV